MKKIKILLSLILLVSVMTTILVGCNYDEETKEYELLTVRRYQDVKEKGLFTTKKDVEWRIEYTYKTETGIEKYDFEEKWDFYMEISEENKVVLEKEDAYPTLHITLDKYKELYGIDESNNN